MALAVVEAKEVNHSADEGYNQSKTYVRLLDIPLAYASNGKDLIEHDRLSSLSRTMIIEDLPSDEELWQRYLQKSNLTEEQVSLITFLYYISATGKKPRYYQQIAINKIVEAIARGQKRIMLIMAIGTGKTFTAFQII